MAVELKMVKTIIKMVKIGFFNIIQVFFDQSWYGYGYSITAKQTLKIINKLLLVYKSSLS